MSKGFVSTESKGFHMIFSNGLVASVQWGYGNYCDNRHNSNVFYNSNTYNANVSSETAEVAVWKANEWLNANDFVPEECRGDCDTVVGYMTPEQVVDFLYNVKNYNGKE